MVGDQSSRQCDFAGSESFYRSSTGGDDIHFCSVFLHSTFGILYFYSVRISRENQRIPVCLGEVDRKAKSLLQKSSPFY